MRHFALLLAFFSFSSSALLTAGPADGDGHRIVIEIEGYEQPILTLANNLLVNQYIVDTATRDDKGRFVFAGDNKLPAGIYLAVMAPDNQYFQVLVTDEEQEFTIATSKTETVKKVRIKGSRENVDFFAYLNYLADARKRGDKLREERDALAEDAPERENYQRQIDALDGEVEAWQRAYIKKNPTAYTAAIIKSTLPNNPPEFTGEDARERGWRWMQAHYFDNLDLRDERLLRTPFLFQRIDYFVHKLNVQHPDSIAASIGVVLNRMDPKSEMFKTYLIHYLNEAAASKLVGMDAIYVYLIDNYYAKGLAPWTEEDQLVKFMENADNLRPLLIGKTAPDIEMERRDGSRISLHDVEAPYTILYFWRYDCGHCKKSTPFMKEFYDKWKSRGVELFAACVKVTKEVPDCWKYVDENGMNDWLNVVDPYLRSRFVELYDLQQTPQIYILDKNKEIISKKIGAEQLDEVMEKIYELDHPALEMNE